ncbi:MAG: universal stress protein [Ferrovibrio sp.]|uniref:universal stress protein n=1 Tax=Ferrovibrio sp. TaxID=1917215 RepID=UPI0026203F75|nr:universal stress protein [Ferrovibrio sp.]MCW0235766.1 universal stress protein [Ferrovibrio sp.]
MTANVPVFPRQLVFATNFSEACHSAIPLVAQWVDALQARLTLLHVHARGEQATAQRALHSFFAEAANYPGCERVLLSGDPARGIAAFCREHPQALLVMPPSSRRFLPRPLHVSLRTRVLRDVVTPMMTLPYTDAIPEPPQPGGHVACWLTGRERRLDHLREAAAIARRRGAELHLFYALPEISEGLMMEAMTAPRPFAASAATRWLDHIVDHLGDDLTIRLQLATGSAAQVLQKLLRRSRANILVADRDATIHSRLLRASLSSAGASRYLLICVPPRDDEGFDPMLPPGPTPTLRLPTLPRFARPPRVARSSGHDASLRLLFA